MPKISLFGLWYILFEFSISKQKCVNDLSVDKESLELKGML